MENDNDKNLEIEKVLEKIDNLERKVKDLKEELSDLKNKDNVDINSDIGRIFGSFSDLNFLTREIKHVMKQVFKSNFKQKHHHFRHDRDFDFDFSFDFSQLNNIGEFISNTVNSALSSLDNLTDSFDSYDFDYDVKNPRKKVNPGLNIRIDKEFTSKNEEFLPNINDVLHAKEILSQLENKIMPLEGITTFDDLKMEELELELSKLKEKGLLIQEKSGQKRYMLTKLGKKMIQMQKDQKSGEENNN